MLLCVLTLAGCKRPVSNPETLDPIYSDFLAQAAGINTKVEAQQKKIEELRAQIARLEPRDPILKRTQREKENFERGLLQMKQDVTYFKIRAEQRRLYDHEAYLKAFNADKEWPPAGEFKDYQESKKLRTGSRNWEDKVPKATQYNKPVVIPVKEKKPGGE